MDVKVDDWGLKLSPTGLMDRDIHRIQKWITDELQETNLNWPPGTGMSVAVARDLESKRDLLRITFHDHNGRMHHIDQYHVMFSLYGSVKLYPETIATIMLLLG